LSDENRIKAVLDWCSNLTAEEIPISSLTSDYLWPEVIKKALSNVQRQNGAMYGIVGLQGTGKSSAFLALTVALCEIFPETEVYHTTMSPVVNFEWPNDADWREAVWRQAGEAADDALFKLIDGEAAAIRDSDKAFRERVKRQYKNSSWENIEKSALLSTKQKTELRNVIIDEILRVSKVILIDMPDYPKKDMRLLNRDIGGLRALWMKTRELGGERCFIFFFQKELFGQHMFYNKMNMDELKPFTAEELVEAYKKKFNETAPFDETALLEIARMSQGVFRRYKRYIAFCLIAFDQQQAAASISIDDVRRTITIDHLIADMQLQLVEVFPNVEHRALAVRIIEYVRLHPDVNQMQLAEALETNEVAVSRISNKLQEQGYIKKTLGEGGEKKLSFVHLCTGPSIREILKTSKGTGSTQTRRVSIFHRYSK
jgi:hypothetical protein